MKVHKVYEDMIKAADKAQRASSDYNARDEFLSKERGYGAIQKDSDYYLKKHFSRYTFWRGEQIRLGELIQSQKAYYELCMYESENKENSTKETIYGSSTGRMYLDEPNIEEV